MARRRGVINQANWRARLGAAASQAKTGVAVTMYGVDNGIGAKTASVAANMYDNGEPVKNDVIQLICKHR